MKKESKLERLLKGLSIRFVMAAGVFLAALLAFAAIADEMVLEQENHLDHVIFNWMAPFTNPATTRVMEAITFFGSSPFLFPAYVLLILYFLFWKKNRWLSLEIAATGIAGTILLFSLKSIFHRSRPADQLVQTVNSFSFPSGHTFSAFTFCGLLIYLLWNHRLSLALRWTFTVFFFLAACAVAFSRIYLHVHYPSDVLAGFCLCVVWLGITFSLFQLLRKKQLP